MAIILRTDTLARWTEIVDDVPLVGTLAPVVGAEEAWWSRNR